MLRRVCIGLISFYKAAVSPFKPKCCRFEPTCSEYAKDAFLLHGVIKGAMLTFCRIVRCAPWGGSGYDPVPLPTIKRKKK